MTFCLSKLKITLFRTLNHSDEGSFVFSNIDLSLKAQLVNIRMPSLLGLTYNCTAVSIIHSICWLTFCDSPYILSETISCHIILSFHFRQHIDYYLAISSKLSKFIKNMGIFFDPCAKVRNHYPLETIAKIILIDPKKVLSLISRSLPFLVEE